MHELPAVTVAMATYNGEQFLPEQLASLEQQSQISWRLVICDDGSSDQTVDLLRAFQSDHPDRVHILDLPPSGSPKANFSRILRSIPPDSYVALCDQDDVWKQDKLHRLMLECVDLESAAGPQTPCLVFSDLCVVDAKLTTIAPSFAREIDTDQRRVSFGSELVENSIPGCSMLLNPALLQAFQAYDGPVDDIRMHDWWLALIAFSMGRVEYVPEPLVLYRQHSANSAGSTRRRGFFFIIRKVFCMPHSESALTIRQSMVFRQAYESLLTGAPRAQVTAHASLDGAGKLTKVWTCWKHGLLKQGTRRRIYQMIRL